MAKALTAMPLAATGLPPPGQPVAVATLTVGIQECCGGGSTGAGPKVCAAETPSFASSQAASGSANAPIQIASNIFLRILVPFMTALYTQCRKPAHVRGLC